MTQLKTTPLHSNFVVEVHSSISDVVDDPLAIDELKAIWQQFPVMIFRRQAFQESDLVRFSERFGICDSTVRKDIQSPYYEQIIYFSTLKYANGNFVGGFAGGDDVNWHSDQTYQRQPATGAILYGTEVPQDGGDIYWADQYSAWERLPRDVQSLIEGKTGVFRYAKRYAALNALELKEKSTANSLLSLPDARHPIALQHPITGRVALYADPTTLVSIDGLTPEQNDAVLPVLFEAGGHASLVYRHAVRNGDLMMWDNGCTMHRRDAMSLAQPRLMKRTTFRLPVGEHCLPNSNPNNRHGV